MTLQTDVFAQRPRDKRVPVLETARLLLRAPRTGDSKALVALAADRRVAENTVRIPHPYRLGDAEAFVAAANRRSGEASFVIARGDELIGACGVEFREDVAEIGYFLGVPFWGRGYATEATRALIDYAFGDLGHDRLAAGARVKNPASRRVLEKCGFQWSGVALYRIKALRSSAPVDRFRLDYGLWSSLKAWGQVRQVA
jgi:RimJ/RimL family protein N-acetyltransferase